MKQWKEWLRDRYGFDSLTYFLLLICMLCNILSFASITKTLQFLSYAPIVGLIPLIVSIFRIFSCNYEQRIYENDRFLTRIEPLLEQSEEKKQLKKEKKIFKFFKCPSCNQLIRVPKGKGRIEITCPKCSRKFIKKT